MPRCRPWVKKSKADQVPETRAPMAGRGSPEAISRPFQTPSGKAWEGLGIQPLLSPLLLLPIATESHHRFTFPLHYYKNSEHLKNATVSGPLAFALAFPSTDLECSLLDLYMAGSFRSLFKSFLWRKGHFPVYSI